MFEQQQPTGLKEAIDACADCIHIYRAAAETVNDVAWQQFMLRMAMKRETLLHRLRFAAETKVDHQEVEELGSYLSTLAEITLNIKQLFGDEVTMALETIEPAETRLLERIGAIGVAAADVDEIKEIIAILSVERDSVRSLLSDVKNEVVATSYLQSS